MSRSPAVERYVSEHPDAVLENLRGRLELKTGPHQFSPERLNIGGRSIECPWQDYRAVARMTGRRVHAVLTRTSPRSSLLLSIHTTDHATDDQGLEEIAADADDVENSPLVLAFAAVSGCVTALENSGNAKMTRPIVIGSRAPDSLGHSAATLGEMDRRGIIPPDQRQAAYEALKNLHDLIGPEVEMLDRCAERLRPTAPIYITERDLTWVATSYRHVAAACLASMEQLSTGTA